jgi:hypothetical protein
MNDKDDCPVSDKLCLARMETLRTEIKGIKQAVYISGAAITTVIVVAEWIITNITR